MSNLKNRIRIIENLLVKDEEIEIPKNLESLNSEELQELYNRLTENSDLAGKTTEELRKILANI